MAKRTKQNYPKVPGPGKFGKNSNNLQRALDYLMGTVVVSKLTSDLYNRMKDRDFEPIRPGAGETLYNWKGERLGDYYDEPMAKYDHRKPTDAPMTTITGQTRYDMTNRGPEGEVLHKEPMTGNRTMTKYNMTSTPSVNSLNTTTDVAPSNNLPKVNLEEVNYYENPSREFESELATRDVINELKHTDINTIEDFERPKNNKRVIKY